jgi:hypothetical protein
MNKGFMASYLKFLQGERDSTSPPPTQTARGGRKSSVWQSQNAQPSQQQAKNLLNKKDDLHDGAVYGASGHHPPSSASPGLPKERKRKNNQNNKSESRLGVVNDDCAGLSGANDTNSAASVIMNQQGEFAT